MNAESPNAGRLALVLEELLMHPRYPELAESLNATLPTNVADQHRASQEDAHRLLAAEAADLGVPVDDAAIRELSGWVRLSLLSTLASWHRGTGSTCMHAPSPDRPEPVIAMAWRPDLVVCTRCPHLLRLPPSSAANRTCDCCGRVVAGLEHGDGIRPCRIQFASMVFAYGACGDCQPSTRGAAA